MTQNIKLYFLVGLVILICILGLKTLLYDAPSSFPLNSFVNIEEGKTLKYISNKLSNENFIRSGFVFRNLVIILGGDGSAMAGEYFFDRPTGLLEIAKRIVDGRQGIEPVRVTLVEGSNLYEMADVLEESLEDFDRQLFLELSEEGYMFPDTYFLLPNIKTEDVVYMLKSMFEQKTAELKKSVEERNIFWPDMVKMASIIEEEASNSDDRQVISGILWNRIEIDMPLQVDVSFQKINGKTSEDLTLEDLEIESPYNSYVNLGLPPTPISNPGLDSIYAAVYPEKTDYFYFLSDDSGNTYFAKNFEEHKRNKALYLK